MTMPSRTNRAKLCGYRRHPEERLQARVTARNGSGLAMIVERTARVAPDAGAPPAARVLTVAIR